MPIELGSFSLGAAAGSTLTVFISHILVRIRDIEGRSAKDFNEKSAVLADILARERIEPNPESNIDFIPFSLVLRNRELKKFDKCVEKYELAKKSAQIFHYNDDTLCIIGSGRYYDSAPIIAAIDNLLKFTKRK